MNHTDLEMFLAWLVDKQKFHELFGNSQKSNDAFKLNHSSRALAFLEVRKELESRFKKERKP